MRHIVASFVSIQFQLTMGQVGSKGLLVMFSELEACSSGLLMEAEYLSLSSIDIGGFSSTLEVRGTPLHNVETDWKNYWLTLLKRPIFSFALQLFTLYIYLFNLNSHIKINWQTQQHFCLIQIKNIAQSNFTFICLVKNMIWCSRILLLIEFNFNEL